MSSQDLRSDADVRARARGGSILAWPGPRGKISEKLLRPNVDLLDYFTDGVKTCQKAFLNIPVLTAVLTDVALYWLERPLEVEDPFEYMGAKADAKALKAAILCLRRLRCRSDCQRHPEVSRVAVNCQLICIGWQCKELWFSRVCYRPEA